MDSDLSRGDSVLLLQNILCERSVPVYFVVNKSRVELNSNSHICTSSKMSFNDDTLTEVGISNASSRMSFNDDALIEVKLPKAELNSDLNICTSSRMSFNDDALTEVQIPNTSSRMSFNDDTLIEVGKPGTNSSFMGVFVDPIGRRLGKNQKYFIN